MKKITKITLIVLCVLSLSTRIHAQQNALDFRKGDHVVIAPDATLNFGTTFTLEALIRASTVNSQFPTILSNRIDQGTSSPGFTFFIRFGRLNIQIGGSNTTPVGPYLLDNKCHHIAVVRNAKDSLLAYIDGERFVLQSANTGNMNNTHALWMGLDDAYQAATQFLGVMDEVRIWNIARTKAQIQSAMNTSISPALTGLVAYYQFNQGIAGGLNTSETSLIDATTTPNNGTINHFVRTGLQSNFVKAPCTSPCDIFRIAAQDTNCCSAGIERNLADATSVESVSYYVSGGVIQGYTTNCSIAAPASTSLSGSASGTVSFTPDCTNLQYFNTSLQSTNSTGNMTVTYTVHYSKGDSCVYTQDVVGCHRAPQTDCDKFSLKKCVCPGASQDYFDIYIQNNAIPTSPICEVKVTRYGAGGTIINWVSGFIFNGIPLTSTQANSTINNSSGLPVVTYGNILHMQFYYFSSFTSQIKITVIHCNGDTCRYIWRPRQIPSGDVSFADLKVEKGKNPYNKLFAYTFKIAGPSKSYNGESPYQVKYITLSIKDTSGKTEIAAVTGAEQYFVKERYKILSFSSTSHARWDALLELSNSLQLSARDSSGVFQVIFANKLPKDLIFNCYDDSGNVLSSGVVTLDTDSSGGIIKMGKRDAKAEGLMLFSGYPTPTTGKYNLKVNLPGNDNITLHVYDISGREVLTHNMGILKDGLSDGVIELGSLENGNYFINAVGEKGQVSNTIKVILIK